MCVCVFCGLLRGSVRVEVEGGRWGGHMWVIEVQRRQGPLQGAGETSSQSLTRRRRAPFMGSRFICILSSLQIKRQSQFEGCTNRKVSVSWWIQMLRVKRSWAAEQRCRSVCESVSLEVGVNLHLKNDHWLPMMHNREGLESTKQQTVWWSTKMCSSGAHWKMIAD